MHVTVVYLSSYTLTITLITVIQNTIDQYI